MVVREEQVGRSGRSREGMRRAYKHLGPKSATAAGQ